jgi:hypothetical protein
LPVGRNLDRRLDALGLAGLRVEIDLRPIVSTAPPDLCRLQGRT